MDLTILAGVAAPTVISAAVGLVILSWRKVVPADQSHIVQQNGKSYSYGVGEANTGNVYYKWPEWLPKLGVSVKELSVSVFSLKIDGYAAYDKGRLPFELDITGFFRIANPVKAAERVSNQQQLEAQLRSILEGAARTILASKDIETILEGRSEFGEAFTAEVKDQLKEWGCEAVKNIELMDIRDAKGSNVIGNIMEKRKSFIEKESRIEVAQNNQEASEKEIQTQRQVELQKQQALEEVGIRKTQQERAVGIAAQLTQQEIAEAQKQTTQKNMEVRRIEEVQTAEIQKTVAETQAEQAKKTSIINAEANKQQSILVAEGQKSQAILKAEADLETQKRSAEGIQLVGEAKAAAEKALQLAPVEAQIVLAKEIGENVGYQQYLVTIEQVNANKEIGIAQADALKAAQIKVIANGGTIQEGVSSIGDIFSSKGGTGLASALEGLAQTEAGQALVNKIVGSKPAK